MADEGRQLELIEALHRWNVIGSEQLPQVGTELLACGMDTPSLSRLAGLDLEPFDARDAADLFARVMEEASNDAVDAETAVAWAACFLARLIVRGDMSPREGTQAFYRLGVAAGYPRNPPELMRLYGLDDMWDLNLEPEDVIADEVRSLADRIVKTCAPEDVDLDAVAAVAGF